MQALRSHVLNSHEVWRSRTNLGGARGSNAGLLTIGRLAWSWMLAGLSYAQHVPVPISPGGRGGIPAGATLFLVLLRGAATGGSDPAGDAWFLSRSP